MRSEIKTLLPAVFKAGEEVAKIYATAFSVTWKGQNDPLTEADLITHKILKEAVLKAYPNDFFLSEEEEISANRREYQRVWILDPIDGTREFVNKNPEFAISLGLSISGIPVLGFIYNPITQEIFIGDLDLGVYYDSSGIYSTPENDLFKKYLNSPKPEKPRMVVSKSEWNANDFSGTFWKENFSIQPIGSIAYKLALVAVQKADIVISVRPKSEWDICAGVALVLASGGVSLVLNDLLEHKFNDLSLNQKGIISGNKNLVDFLIQENAEFLKSSFRPRT